MNDVVAVGLTTGTVGLVGSVLGYFSARHQSRATFAIGIQNAQIELAKVRSENDRLRQQHREDERRERRSAYVGYLAAFKHFDSFGFITSATEDGFLAAQTKFRLSHSALMMVASDEVRTRASALDDLLCDVVDVASADLDRPGMEAWRGAYQERSDALKQAENSVTDAMHQDVIAKMITDRPE